MLNPIDLPLHHKRLGADHCHQQTSTCHCRQWWNHDHDHPNVPEGVPDDHDGGGLVLATATQFKMHAFTNPVLSGTALATNLPEFGLVSWCHQLFSPDKKICTPKIFFVFLHPNVLLQDLWAAIRSGALLHMLCVDGFSLFILYPGPPGSFNRSPLIYTKPPVMV